MEEADVIYTLVEISFQLEQIYHLLYAFAIAIPSVIVVVTLYKFIRGLTQF